MLASAANRAHTSPMRVSWYGKDGVVLRVDEVDEPLEEGGPPGALYYEFQRNGVTISRRAGWKPKMSAGDAPHRRASRP